MWVWWSPLFRNDLIILNIFIMTEFDDCSAVAETSDDSCLFSWYFLLESSFCKRLLCAMCLKWRCRFILKSIVVWCNTLNITTCSSVQKIYRKIVRARLCWESLTSHCKRLEYSRHRRNPFAVSHWLSAETKSYWKIALKKPWRTKQQLDCRLWPTSTYVQ